LELFGKSDSGAGQFLGLNLTHLINEKNSLTLINDEQYVNYENRFSTNHGLIWGHRFSDTTQTNTSLIFEYESVPKNFHLRQYVLAVGFDHIFYRRVLTLNVTPYIIYLHRPEYDEVHGVNLNLMIIL